MATYPFCTSELGSDWRGIGDFFTMTTRKGGRFSWENILQKNVCTTAPGLQCWEEVLYSLSTVSWRILGSRLREVGFILDPGEADQSSKTKCLSIVYPVHKTIWKFLQNLRVLLNVRGYLCPALLLPLLNITQKGHLTAWGIIVWTKYNNSSHSTTIFLLFCSLFFTQHMSTEMTVHLIQDPRSMASSMKWQCITHIYIYTHIKMLQHLVPAVNNQTSSLWSFWP